MARRPSRLAAQSAMEYLMTYGWAILIIAVVLAALFELGVFNGSNLAPQACIAQAGFVCKNPVYTANGIGITFGQTNGRDYYGDWVFVASQGEALNQNGIPINFTCTNAGCANAVSVGVLVPGQIVGVDFNASKFAYGQILANAPIGTPFAGYVWLGYCFSPCSAPTAYSKVATITAKEAGTSSASFGGYFGGASGSSASPPPPAPQFSFTVSLSPTSNTIAAGQSTHAVVTITTPISNNANVVTLSDTAPPTITKTFKPVSCTPDPTCNSTLSINTTASAQPGSYPITVTGTNALTGATNSTAYTLTVTSPYVQITLNPGSTISGTFQQNITFNPSAYSAYESSDLGNIRFYSSMSGNVPSGPLDSWLEGCPETACTPSSSQAIFWVKLPNGETSGENIYMVFGPTSGTGSEFDGSIAGEAPQISQTYAQYDNGANVFLSYFNGDTPTSDFTITSGYTLAQVTRVTMPNGNTGNAIHITGYNTASPASDIPFVYNNGYTLQPSIAEASAQLQSGSTPNAQGIVGLLTSTAISSASGIGVTMGFGSSYFSQEYESSGSVTAAINQQGSAVTSWVYGSVTFAGTSSTSWTGYIAPQLYSTSGGYSETVTTQPITSGTTLYLSSLGSTGSLNPYNLYINWARVRAYPPGGNMPGAMLGPVQ